MSWIAVRARVCAHQTKEQEVAEAEARTARLEEQVTTLKPRRLRRQKKQMKLPSWCGRARSHARACSSANHKFVSLCAKCPLAASCSIFKPVNDLVCLMVQLARLASRDHLADGMTNGSQRTCTEGAEAVAAVPSPVALLEPASPSSSVLAATDLSPVDRASKPWTN